MKILYAVNKYDYGEPKRGLGYEYYNFYDTLIKMNNGNNKVKHFPPDEIAIKYGKERMNQKLLESVFEEELDIVFFVIQKETIKKEVIKEITQKSGAITLNWFTDDHWQFNKYSKYWAFYFNWVTTTDAEAVKKYHKIGYKNVIKTQWACNHFIYKPLNLPRTYDVTFIGAAHGNRKKLIKKIKEEGIDIKCWGAGWPEGRISQEDMLRIFSQSKININFTKSSGVIWKELASIFLHRDYNRSIRINNPKYWIDNFRSVPPSIWSKQIKGRNFEIPGCGGFLLTEYVNHLEDYYKIGEEIDCFKNITELIKKIKYYLEHNEERENMAKAGYERTIREHTFEKRFNEIFKTIGLTK